MATPEIATRVFFTMVFAISRCIDVEAFPPSLFSHLGKVGGEVLKEGGLAYLQYKAEESQNKYNEQKKILDFNSARRNSPAFRQTHTDFRSIVQRTLPLHSKVQNCDCSMTSKQWYCATCVNPQCLNCYMGCIKFCTGVRDRSSVGNQASNTPTNMMVSSQRSSAPEPTTWIYSNITLAPFSSLWVALNGTDNLLPLAAFSLDGKKVNAWTVLVQGFNSTSMKTADELYNITRVAVECDCQYPDTCLVYPEDLTGCLMSLEKLGLLPSDLGLFIANVEPQSLDITVGTWMISQADLAVAPPPLEGYQPPSSGAVKSTGVTPLLAIVISLCVAFHNAF